MTTLLANILRPGPTATGSDPQGHSGAARSRMTGKPRFPRILRSRRLAAALFLAGSLAAAIVTSAAPASASTPAFVVGSFSCPGNTMTVNAPYMAQVRDDAGENGYWEPVLQGWQLQNNQWQWVNVGFVPGTYFNATIFNGQVTGWYFRSGVRAGNAYTWNVNPGHYNANGTYSHNYYRVANYYKWTDLADQAITGWYGPVYSPYYANPADTYCAF